MGLCFVDSAEHSEQVDEHLLPVAALAAEFDGAFVRADHFAASDDLAVLGP